MTSIFRFRSFSMVSALLLLAITAHAQIPISDIDKAIPSFADWGIKAGGNFEQISGFPFKQSYDPGGMGGAYICIHGRTLGLKLEATASMAHYSSMYAASYAFTDTKSSSADTVTKADFTTLSVNVPLLIEVRPCRHFLFEFGGQYTQILSVTDKSNAFKNAWNTDKVFKTSYYSMIMGIEEDITRRLKLGATYTAGMSDINNAAFKGLNDYWYASSAQVYLVYKIKKWYHVK